eukprot:6646643-Heterocapsa_arctica.AAC.1
MLLQETQHRQEKTVDGIRAAEQKDAAQMDEMRNANESVMREWRPEHDKVCAFLRPNGLEFEEALCKQVA